jgi:hypothetical protein
MSDDLPAILRDIALTPWRERWEDDRYPVATQRCPSCRRTFRVLADEAGMHDCPHCGWGPEVEGEDPDREEAAVADDQ